MSGDSSVSLITDIRGAVGSLIEPTMLTSSLSANFSCAFEMTLWLTWWTEMYNCLIQRKMKFTIVKVLGRQKKVLKYINFLVNLDCQNNTKRKGRMHTVHSGSRDCCEICPQVMWLTYESLWLLFRMGIFPQILVNISSWIYQLERAPCTSPEQGQQHR